MSVAEKTVAADNGTGLRTMLERIGQPFVPLPDRVDLPGISDQRLSDSTKMLLAMSRKGMKIYEGTANPGHVARRRAKNKRARLARRASRR